MVRRGRCCRLIHWRPLRPAVLDKVCRFEAGNRDAEGAGQLVCRASVESGARESGEKVFGELVPQSADARHIGVELVVEDAEGVREADGSGKIRGAAAESVLLAAEVLGVGSGCRADGRALRCRPARRSCGQRW